MSCEQYIRESRTKCSLTRLPLGNTNDYITVPENAMQIDIDLVPELPTPGGFEYRVTFMDVFSPLSLCLPDI